MSGEHVWSDWIGKLFTDYKGIYSFSTKPAKDKPDLRWRTRSIDMKAHVVCESCNNTWMSDLDGEAKATMKDMIRYAAYISLLPRGIASIAAFAFKTAVVADHIRPRGIPFFSHNVRKQFAVNFAVPNGVQVWLSAFRGKHLLSGRYSTIYAKIRMVALRVSSCTFSLTLLVSLHFSCPPRGGQALQKSLTQFPFSRSIRRGTEFRFHSGPAMGPRWSGLRLSI